MMNAQQLLENLTTLYASRDMLNVAKKQAIPADVQKVLDDIEAEFAPQMDNMNKSIAELEALVKAAVLSDGQSASGGSLQAVYAKGRVTWETAKLEGYVKAHPELAEYRKVGEPSVSIRRKA